MSKSRVAIVIVSVLLLVPSFWMGFQLDDYVSLWKLGARRDSAASDNLFAFIDGDSLQTAELARQGVYPWWIDDELKIVFLRPLSDTLVRLDHALFGERAVGYHLHSLVWWVLTLLAAAQVLRRTLPGSIGTCALLVFALAHSHALPAAWISNRNALVAIAPALLGLVCLLRWREDGWRPGRALSIVGFGIGLLGGEVGFAMLAYPLAYELLGDGWRGRWTRPRLAGALPYALLGVMYLVLHRVAGFGVSGSGIYIHPLSDPIAFMDEAPRRMLSLLSGGLLGFSADYWFVSEPMRHRLVVAGVVAVVVLVLMVRVCRRSLDVRSRASLRWLLAGSLAILVPASATFPADRMLLASQLGLAGLLGAFMVLAWRSWRGERRRGLVVGGVLLATVHLVLAPIMIVGTQALLIAQGRAALAVARSPAFHDTTGHDVVLLTAPDHVVGIYVPLILAHLDRLYMRSWRVLSLAPHHHRVTRTDARTLELEVVDGVMMRSLFEELYRDRRHPLSRGAVLERGLLRIEILESQGGAPRRVAFRFDRDLSDPALHFLIWDETGLRRIDVPAVGASLELPHILGPVGL